MLEFKNVTHIYSPRTPFCKTAVDGLSFVIEDNLTVGLIGHTGSGKSTVAQLCNALLSPTSGEILLDGENIHASKEIMYKTRSRVGLVFQYPEYQLFEETVAKDIAFGPKNMGLSDGEISERVKNAAKFVGIPEELFEKSPFELSGGQKRRVAIAGVIAMDPEILILDEPAAGLDPRGRDEILGGLVKYRKKRKNSLVLISHSMEDIAKYSDRILALDSGKMLAYGTPAEVFSHYDELTASGLALPEITRIMHELKKDIPELPDSVFSVEDAAKILEKYLPKRSERK